MIIKQPCTLLMFSGGLDSLAALHVLRESGERVHVHHVHIHNIEARAAAEHKAVDAVRHYYTTAGDPLDYSESIMQFPTVNGGFLYDTDVTRFMGGYIASRSGGMVKAVAYGRTADDVADRTLSSRTEPSNELFKVFTNTPMIFPVVQFTKRECSALLPPELRQLSWSCRRPIYTNDGATPCGKCKACKALANIT